MGRKITDGLLIDSVLSMNWADYRSNNKKAKAHVGFNLDNQITHKIYLDSDNSMVKEIVYKNEISPSSIVFYDACGYLGSEQNDNKTKKPLRLIAYKVDGINYWIATDRFDLSASFFII
ncbi:MAG: hypothetical protein HOD92_24560 [Deltaproteobacteria bacterium]|jgi:hypothetical protein|nr:hypothetical protein [Deltaproteobacteria bacterium]